MKLSENALYKEILKEIPESLIKDYGDQLKELCIKYERHGYIFEYGWNLNSVISRIKQLYPVYF